MAFILSDDAEQNDVLIVIGYDDNVKGLSSCLNVLSFPFVYFGSPCLYRYERVSTKIKLLIGWL